MSNGINTVEIQGLSKITKSQGNGILKGYFINS